jgi:hypothetical protein
LRATLHPESRFRAAFRFSVAVIRASVATLGGVVDEESAITAVLTITHQKSVGVTARSADLAARCASDGDFFATIAAFDTWR